MNKAISIFVIILTLAGISCSSNEKSINIILNNPVSLDRVDEIATLNIDSIKTGYPDFDAGSFMIYDNEMPVPYQIEVKDGVKLISLATNLASEEKKILILKYPDEFKSTFKSRTYAELSMKPGNVYIDGKFRGDKFTDTAKIKVPAIHTDHDALFKYEGPGWESEKIGYRFYLDWRNANDIFGKKVNKLLLSNIGVHDTVAQDDSYHSMMDWGMDIFNVGKSLGIGSIGMWYDGKVNMVSKTDSVFCEIQENGPVRSAVRTSYFGWRVGEMKYDLVSTLSIAAGSRLTKCELEISNHPEIVVTGLAKYKGTEFLRSNGNEEWCYIALYGNQTLAGPEDKLGIAVFYERSRLIELTEDALNYVLKLKPENGKADYYFCAAWEQEPDGIKTKNDFIKYLDDTVELLNHPVTVKVD